MIDEVQLERVAPALSRFATFVADELGLHFPPDRLRDLMRGVQSYADAAGFENVEACLASLTSKKLAPAELEDLSSHLTVGETYFYREGRIFEILEQHILPDLVQKRQAEGRRLRIWSAACCSGEEPYSLAIALTRAIPDLKDWTISLLASDINPRFLAKATEGTYSEWSFRNTPPWLRDRHFRKTAPGKWAVSREIKQLPTFANLNLAKDTFPSVMNQTNALDLIFCRNVLIYFTPDQAQRVLLKLSRCLSDGGWLVLGSSEQIGKTIPQLNPVSFDGLVVYRKGAALAPMLKPAIPAPPPAVEKRLLAAGPTVVNVPTSPQKPKAPDDDKDKAALKLYERGDYAGVIAALGPAPTKPAELKLLAKTCANLGNLTDSLAWCDKLLAADQLEPSHQYLRAIVLVELGRTQEATAVLERTLYLDPHFVSAYLTLGNLARQEGRSGQKYFDQALSILKKLPADAVVEESDGLTVARLIEVIETLRNAEKRAGEK